MARSLYHVIDLEMEDVFDFTTNFWVNNEGTIKVKNQTGNIWNLVVMKHDSILSQRGSLNQNTYILKFRRLSPDLNKTEVVIEINLGDRGILDLDMHYYMPSRLLKKWASSLGASSKVIGKHEFILYTSSAICCIITFTLIMIMIVSL